jgi:hypothetical protein
MCYLAFSGCGTREKGSSIEAARKLDPCESLRESDPHCGWEPHWVDVGPFVSEMDGKATQLLAMQSIDPDGIDFGKLHYAELRLHFDDGQIRPGKHIAVGVNVHGTVNPISMDSEYSTTVRLKFDDGRPRRETWGISDDRQMLFPYGKEKQFIGELLRHSVLIVEFSYFESAPRTIKFKLDGLAEIMNSQHLKL